jgi:transcriptional regulator with XRE-family HTH domain
MDDRRTRPQWVKLGREMRRLREKAGLTQSQLGKQLSMSYGAISGIERGVRGTKPEYLARIDRILSTEGALYGMWQAMSDGHGIASWSRDAADLEKGARAIQICQALLIPGLFQTENYMRAVIASGQTVDTQEEIEEGVQARLRRQEIIAGDNPPLVQAVLDETVLRRPVGGATTMSDQLTKLLKLSQWPRLAIQVVPVSTGYYPALDGVFHLYTLHDRREALYTETKVSSLVVEDPHDVDMYKRAWGEARGLALPPHESRALMEQIRGELHDR